MKNFISCSENRPSDMIRNTLSFFMYALIGATAGILGAKYFQSLFGPMDMKQKFFLVLILFLSIYVSIFLQLIIHEAGHLVFGLMTGYKFVSFRIGSTIFLKSNGKMVKKRYFVQGTGGQCLMAPPPYNGGNFPQFLYNMGGVIFNILVSLLALFLFLFTKFLPLLVFAICGIVIAVSNGIPMKTKAVNNDGLNALNIKKDKSASHAFYMQLLINAHLSQGERMKDMPDDWFSMPRAEEMDDGLTAGYGAYVAMRELDQKDFQKAYWDMEFLIENASGLIGVHKVALLSEILFLELIGENRWAKVESLYTPELEKPLQLSPRSPSALRTLYAYELIHKRNFGKAERHKMAFESALTVFPNAGEAEMEKELFDLVKPGPSPDLYN